MQRSIATVSLGGTLIEKLSAIAAAGFDGVEIFETDLMYFDGTPAAARRVANDLGLKILLFQPFRDFEAAPRNRWQRNLDRAERKFDLMEQLGADLMLVCSNVAPDAVDDDGLATSDLRALAEHAARRGLRIGYEALSWGRHVRTFGHAWRIVEAANHPALGLVVDSFHTLALEDDDALIAQLPGDRIFFVQVADAPLMRLDLLSWSRHFRCFPGQGALPVNRFVRHAIDAGYTGPISLEIFNDEFRAASPRPIAVDAMRSLLLLEEELIGAADLKVVPGPLTRFFAPPAPPACHGVAFVEFAVDSETRPRLAALFDAMGFGHAGTHRSKDVTVHRQGDINLILNAEKDSFAHSFFLLHGPSVCALALQVDDAQHASERATQYRAQTFRGRIGPNELMIPAIRGVEGSLIYLVDHFGEQGSIYDVDFSAAKPGAAEPHADCGLAKIDHIAQVVWSSQFDSLVLFYKSVLGFEAEAMTELVDPYGLVRSRVVNSRDRTVRLPLNASASAKTSTARFLSTYCGAGVHHIAMSTTDIFGTVERMRANGVPLLEIPEAYYDNLQAAYDLADDLIERMRHASILYDRSDTGEFFQAYTRAFDRRFFFEIVERRNYDGFGAVNATTRMAAQALLEPSLDEAFI